HRGSAADARRAGVAGLRRPLARRLAGRRRVRRGALHPLLRAGRTCPSRDALAGVQRRPAPRGRGPGELPGVAGRPGAATRGRPARRRDGRDGAAGLSTPVVELRDLRHTYPDGHAALPGVDMHVHPGERVALLGPNGAGKTTLVLHLNGILRPDSGHVTISGLPVADDSLLEVRRRVGIVFQDPEDQLFMPTVAQDVAFGPRNLGL